METVFSFIKTPAGTITLMIVMAVVAVLCLNFVEELALTGKKSFAYQQSRIILAALCAIGYIWLIYLNLWPFINQHDWAFNLALFIFIVAGICFALYLATTCCMVLPCLVAAATWVLSMIAVFTRYEDGLILLLFTFFSLIGVVWLEGGVIGIATEADHDEKSKEAQPATN